MKSTALLALLAFAPAASAVDMCHVGKNQDFQYWIDVSSYKLEPGDPTPVATVRGGTLHPATDRRSYLRFVVRPDDCKAGEGNVIAADELMRNPKAFGTFSADDDQDPAILGRLICRAYKAPSKERARILQAGSCGTRGTEPGDGIGFGRVTTSKPAAQP